MTNFLDGKKTWIGIILTLLGFSGVFKYIAQDQAAQMIDLVFQIVGLIVSAYGNYKAHQK